MRQKTALNLLIWTALLVAPALGRASDQLPEITSFSGEPIRQLEQLLLQRAEIAAYERSLSERVDRVSFSSLNKQVPLLFFQTDWDPRSDVSQAQRSNWRARIGTQGPAGYGFRYKLFGEWLNGRLDENDKKSFTWIEAELSFSLMRGRMANDLRRIAEKVARERELSQLQLEFERASLTRRVFLLLIEAAYAQDRLRWLEARAESIRDITTWMRRAQRNRLLDRSQVLEVELADRAHHRAVARATAELSAAVDALRVWLPRGKNLVVPRLSDLKASAQAGDDAGAMHVQLDRRLRISELEVEQQSEAQVVELEELKPKIDVSVRYRSGCEASLFCSEPIAMLDFDMPLSRELYLKRSQLVSSVQNEREARLGVLRLELRQAKSERESKLKSLAAEIEKVSEEVLLAQERLDSERDRIRRGRSSPFDILRAESDVIDLGVGRIELERELLRLKFQVGPGGEN